ncbi:hypothetical protein HY640_01915 [Candidatus Woesearchaeota archaeon]|nr:hypothetical protein [Candidatus Woesearchaeota archaeon]
MAGQIERFVYYNPSDPALVGKVKDGLSERFPTLDVYVAERPDGLKDLKEVPRKPSFLWLGGQDISAYEGAGIGGFLGDASGYVTIMFEAHGFRLDVSGCMAETRAALVSAGIRGINDLNPEVMGKNMRYVPERWEALWGYVSGVTGLHLNERGVRPGLKVVPVFTEVDYGRVENVVNGVYLEYVRGLVSSNSEGHGLTHRLAAAQRTLAHYMPSFDEAGIQSIVRASRLPIDVDKSRGVSFVLK